MANKHLMPMPKFRVRIRSYLSGLRNFWMLSNKALKKYTDPEKGDYNFLDVVFRIKLTEMQIQEQQKILLSKRRQMPLLLTLLSCLFIYIPKIFAYVKQAVAIEWYEWIIFSLYFLLLISSVLFFYCTIFPKEIPHRYLPSQFYEGILDEYQKEGLDKVEANKGVQSTYLSYLEDILIQYLNCVGKIEKWYTRFMIVLPLAIFFYVASIAVVFVHSNHNQTNNKNKNTMIKDRKIFIPSNTIRINPIVEREGVEIHYSIKPESCCIDTVKPMGILRGSAKKGVSMGKAGIRTNQIRFSK